MSVVRFVARNRQRLPIVVSGRTQKTHNRGWWIVQVITNRIVPLQLRRGVEIYHRVKGLGTGIV